MFSTSRTLRIFVLFTLVASFVQAHDARFSARDHAGIQRMMKKRAPQDKSILGPIVAGAGDDSQNSNSSTTIGSATPTTTDSAVSSTGTGTDTSTSATGSVTGTLSSNSTTTTTSSSTTAAASTTTTAPNETLNILPQVTDVSTVVGSAVTRTASVNASPSAGADRTGATANNNSNNMTATILVAVAASAAGLAILWTVFRKWKLARSKEFDRRLNPNWTPSSNAGLDDSPIPTHRARRASDSSFTSGSGHGHNNGTSLDHDFTAGPTTLNARSNPVGGYADLARGPSPNPMMQEHRMNGGPTYGVPLHHQGGGYGKQGPFEAYDYNGNGVRY